MAEDQRRGFGQVTKLRSGRFQARWRAGGKYHTARVTYADEDHRVDHGPLTFSTRKKAERHLEWVAAEIEAGRWRAPVKPTADDAPTTLRTFADEWIARGGTRGYLKPMTEHHYRQILDRTIYPTLGDLALGDVDQDAVEAWYYALDPKKKTWNAHAYALLRSILTSARKRKLISDVPSIDGAGRSKRKRPLRPLSRAELAALVAEIPERYRVLTLTMAWCALRYGEATALRRRDVDIKRGVLHVDRGVTLVKGQWHEDTPKGDESEDVTIPPNIIDDLKRHVRGLKAGDLVFPAPRGGFMVAATYSKVFRPAAEKIGRPDVRPHDLRHTGLFYAAEAGASPQELMQRGRHKTAQASQVYWHAAKKRDAEIAARMSEMADADNVVPIESKRRKAS